MIMLHYMAKEMICPFHDCFKSMSGQKLALKTFSLDGFEEVDGADGHALGAKGSLQPIIRNEGP